jgi:hypothetical protein
MEIQKTQPSVFVASTVFKAVTCHIIRVKKMLLCFFFEKDLWNAREKVKLPNEN